ncbi:hypothetical protein HK101_000400 [Irineochytrium annulatum]|nr:hypothetical protein HK101_000400 [Irineochytrium annulatum]
MGMAAEAFSLLDPVSSTFIESQQPKRTDEGHIILSVAHIASLTSSILGLDASHLSDSDVAKSFFAMFSPLSTDGINVDGAPDMSEEFVKLFVDPTIAFEKEEPTSATKVVAEFRPVSIVFVSLLFPFDPVVVQKVILCFMHALQLFGGLYQQYAVDDKGQTLLAVFGVQGFSHVNNAEQCVKAVCLFMRNVQSLIKVHDEIRLAISIASGETLCTTIGNELRSDPGLLGDVIVTAARLMSFSEKFGFLVLDQQTNESVKFTNTTVDLGLVKVKGKDLEMQIYGISVSANEVEEVRPMIGYKEERAVLQQRFDSWCESKEKKSIVIEAPSGMGKSYLANFTISQAKARGVQTHAEDTIQKQLASAGVEVDLAPLLSIMSPVFQVEDTPRTLTLDSVAKNNLLVAMTLKIVASFLEKHSAIFVFDDVQWFDSFSLEIILNISKYCSKFFMIILSRPIDPTNQKLNGILSQTSTSHLLLNGMSEAEALEIIVRLLSKRKILTVLQIQRFSCLKTQVSGVDPKLSDAGMLSSEEDMLQVMRAGDMYKFLLLPEEGGSSESVGTISCAFRHIGILNAIYESLSYEERIAAHTTAGEMIESLVTDDTREQLLPALEYHFSRTGEIEKLISYKEKLG